MAKLLSNLEKSSHERSMKVLVLIYFFAFVLLQVENAKNHPNIHIYVLD